MSGGGECPKQPLILVADDDRTVRLLTRARLEQIGFAVVEAENGAKALATFESAHPDVVLLDVMMPELDGYSVCRTLRGLSNCYHLPILMITGLDDIDSIKRAYEAGATDFVTKPLNWEILGHRVLYMWRASLASGELRKSEEKNRALLNAIPDMMFQIRKDGTILDFKAPKDFGLAFSLEDPIGKNICDAFFADSAPPIMAHLARALRTGETQVCEYQVKNGDVVHSFESRIVVSADDEVLAIVRDITERKKAEEQIIQLAYHDTLTGLLNRHSFRQHLTHTLDEAKRYNRLLAVIFLDLDRFKRINDTLGHNVGDLLLQEVADRLTNSIRSSDISARPGQSEPQNAVARFGGDEFITLLTQINSIQDAGKVARRILDSLARPFMLAGHEVYVTSSIGISVFPFDGADADTLLKNADAAMYHAKDQGRNNFQFYTASMNATAFERLALEGNLRRALEREEFTLYYQPQVNIKTGRIVGVEALIRWQHPDMGLVSPAQFIPLAEECGLIVPIGEWVIRTACSQNKTWIDNGFSPIRISVNISSCQFRHESLIETVETALKDTGLDPSLLELELTESAIMQSADRAAIMLKNLKSKGLRLAIDDFGIGYSSLNYLKSFPLDILKIDRSFVRDITTDPDDAAIATAIIAMAHSLNLKVIAEGVETKDQLEFLREKGCDEIQGYLFSPAVFPDALAVMLHENKSLYGKK